MNRKVLVGFITAVLFTLPCVASAQNMLLLGVGKKTVAAGGAPTFRNAAGIMSIPTNSVQAIVNKPTGTVSGDTIVCEYSAYFQTSFSAFTPPAGFNLIRSRVADQAGYPATGIYYRNADGSEGSTFTWTATGVGPYAGSAQCITVTGANVSPVNTSNDALTSSGSTGSFPTVTTTVGNTLLLLFGAGDFNAVQTGSTFPTIVPSTFTLGATGINAADTIYTGSSYKTQAASGATGAFTVTTPTLGIIQGFTIAIQP